MSLGFSIAIHCSTNVLKLMCFFLAGPSALLLDWPLRSWSLLVPPDSSLPVVACDSGAEGPAVPSSAMIRGGEFLRKGRPRMAICVSLFV